MLGIIAFSLALSACRARSWAGIYEGSRELDPGVNAPDHARRSLEKVTLEIREDGSFVLTANGFPFEGQAALGANKGELRLRTLLGKAIPPNENREIDVVRQSDGSLVLSDRDLGTVTLRPKSQRTEQAPRSD